MDNELIGRKKLINDLLLLAKHENGHKQNVTLGIIHTVEMQPTVEATEVIPAVWVRKDPQDPNSGRYCSNCKVEIDSIKALYYKFCFECGANMHLNKIFK